jgi:hypothetical protein
MTTLRRDFKLPTYWVLVGVAVMFFSPILSIFASVKIAERNYQRVLAEQEAARSESREEARKLACAFFAGSLDVYIETPPNSAAGKNLQSRYLEFYKITGCKPPREK